MRGRDFDAADRADTPPVVMVNDTLARRLWPNGDAIGQRLKEAGSNDKPWREVIGIVADVKYDDLMRESSPFFLLPLTQRPASPVTLVVRTAGDEAAILPLVATTVHAIDPNLPLFDAFTLRQVVRRSVDMQQASSSVLGICGLLALLLSALGMYGVTSHAAAIRTKEVGIRMSLGACARDVTAMFIREGLARAAIGVCAGLAISAVISHLLASLLFGLAPTDFVTFAVSAVIVCGAAAVASYVPARRAAAIDPVRTLKSE